MCQFWLNGGSLESAGNLTSPYFDGSKTIYGHNLNCTWMINVQDGFYINLEIWGNFWVKCFKKTYKKVVMIFLKMIIVTVDGR